MSAFSSESAAVGTSAGSLNSLTIPGGWTEQTRTIGDRVFRLLLPADPVEFLNQLDESNDVHLTDPYWSAVWSAAPALAERVARHPWPLPTRALELGCGVGLAGLAALSAGMQVTFSDYVPAAVSLAVENAQRNGFPTAQGLPLDWRDPPELTPFPFVLASDVLYEEPLHRPLLATVDRLLADDGQCWIGDPGRAAASDFAGLARDLGYDVTIDRDEDHLAAEPADPSASAAAPPFQLLVLRRKSCRVTAHPKIKQ